MFKVIIADTSCLIILHNIDLLNILKGLFGEIIITPQVREEFNDSLPDWIKVVEAKNKSLLQTLSISLDKGEASSISLSLEQKDKTLLIIDERKGRKVAKELGINIIGTIGIILKAKEVGKINSLKEIIEKLESSQFRISKQLKDELLKFAKEE